MKKLFFLFIIETLALGELMKVNTFDQPAVEQVKVLTKKFLKILLVILMLQFIQTLMFLNCHIIIV